MSSASRPAAAVPAAARSSRSAKRVPGMSGPGRRASRLDPGRPREPRRDRRRPVLEQLAVGVDPVGARGQGPFAQLVVVVLPDGEHPDAGRARPVRSRPRRRRRARSGRRSRRRSPARAVSNRSSEADADRLRAGRLDRPGQPVGPDEVLGEDDHAGRHDEARSIEDARWWNTSRAVTTPVGRPSSTIGMWRKPADGHLVDGHRDRVVVAEDDRVRGHEVADVEGLQPLAGGLHHRVTVGEDADEAIVGHDEDAVGLGFVHPRDRHVERRVRA